MGATYKARRTRKSSRGCSACLACLADWVAPARRAVLVLGLAAILLGPAAASRRDLGGDESRGGHTLARHVGRTDSQLLDRLAREPRISAASTYTDRATAELVVGLALERERSRVDAWRHRQ